MFIKICFYFVFTLKYCTPGRILDLRYIIFPLSDWANFCTVALTTLPLPPPFFAKVAHFPIPMGRKSNCKSKAAPSSCHKLLWQASERGKSFGGWAFPAPERRKALAFRSLAFHIRLFAFRISHPHSRSLFSGILLALLPFHFQLLSNCPPNWTLHVSVTFRSTHGSRQNKNTTDSGQKTYLLTFGEASVLDKQKKREKILAKSVEKWRKPERESGNTIANS